MKKYTLICLLLVGSLAYAASPEKSAYYDDRFLVCLQPDVSVKQIVVRSGVPVTGIASLDRLLALREILVLEQYLPGSTPDDMDGDIILSNIYRLAVSAGRSDLEQLMADFDADPNVLYAEQEVIYTILYSPNDSRYSNQWYLPKIDAPEAWDLFDIAGGILPGDRAIVLASVDTGVQYTHPDLRDRVWINQAEVPDSIFAAVDANSDSLVTAEEVSAFITDYNGSGTTNLQDALHSSSPFMDGIDDDDWDNDGTSYVDDLFGWDVAGTTSSTSDSDNDPMGTFTGPADSGNKMHGTHVAGLLCAATDNGVGVASTIYNGTLMSVKVLYDESDGGISGGQTGILYAAKAGADIINLSWGGAGYSSADQSVANVVYDTYGALTVAAAGNGNDDGSPSSTPHYPSGYNKVVSVTALGSSDNFSWANYGTEIGIPGRDNYFSGVSISAPGENILSTVYTTAGSYQSWDGTSMASPLVASCFGLLKAAYPEASTDWLLENILATTDSIDHINPNYAGQLGTGRININNALARIIYPRLSYYSHSLFLQNDNGDGLLSPGESALMKINLFNDSGWMDALGVSAILRSSSEYVTITDSTGTYDDINNGNIGQNNIDRYGFSVAADSPSGEYELSLDVTANSGSDNPYSATIVFSIDVSMWQANFPIASSIIKGGNAVVDLDGDGSMEIIFSAYDNNLHAVNTSGNELSGFPVDLGHLAESTPAVGDIDNDGDLEVVVGSLDLNLYVVQHDGSAEAIHTAPGFILAPPSLYDLDGDGDLEIINVSYNNELAVMHHDGTPLENFPITLDGSMTVGAAIGDINADGNVNIVVGTWGDQLHAINLDGTEAAGFPITMADHIRSAPLLANLDGSADGSLDILLGCNDNKLHAYDAAGNELWFVNSSSQDIQADPSVADVDGDGDLEIFVGGLDGLIYGVDHTGTFLSGWPVATGGAIYSSPALADINDDGVAEVFIGSNDRRLYGLYLDGSNIGGFPVENSGNIQGSPSVADLDGDNDLEVIVGSDDKLIVMDLNTNGDAASYWSTHRGNLHRTGVLPTLTPIVEQNGLPAGHRLFANYPNPFNPSTQIAFDIAEASYVKLQVLDIRGRVIDELIADQMTPGSYRVTWQGEPNGRPADAGIYFYRLTTQNGDFVRKMTLLK